MQSVDGDELLHADALLFEIALQRRHLHDVLAQALALNLALLPHVVKMIGLVDAADDGRRGGHRSDEASKNHGQSENGDDDSTAVEEQIADAPPYVARMNLNLDHGRSR